MFQTLAVNKRPFLEVIKEYASSRSSPVVETANERKAPVANEQEIGFGVDKTHNELMGDLKELRSLQEKLIYVCKNGDDHISSEIMNTLVDEEDNVQNLGDFLKKIVDKNTNGCGLLHLCAARGKVKCMEYLIGMRVPVDQVDALSATPLLYAVAAKKEESVSFLLSCGANVNTKDSYNRFPLSIAAKNKCFKIAEALKSVPKCDIHLRGSKGNTVLHVACEDGELSTVQFLVEHCGASPLRRNYDEQNALFTAIKHPAVVNYLASKFSGNGLGKLIVNADCYGRNIFHEAIGENHFDSFVNCVKHLNTSEVTSDQICSLVNEPDRTGDTPLIMAVKAGKADIVRLLCDTIELRINEGDRLGNTALYHAINRKDKKLIDLLSAAGGALKQASHGEQEKAEAKSRKLVDCMKSLNALLIVILCLLVIVSIAVIAAITFSFFGSNNAQNGEKLRQKQFGQVMDFLEGNVKQFTQVAMTAAAAFKGKYNVSDINDVMQYAWQTLPPNFGVVPLVSSSYCGLTTGENGGLQRRSQNRSEIEYFSSYENIYNIKFIRVADIATRTLDMASETNIALTSDADWNGTWVQTPRENFGSRWTLSFATSAYPGMLWMSFMTSFREPVTNKFIGYCGMDAPTEVVRDFIQTSEETRDSTIVIVERQTGYLITTSDTNVVIFSEQGGGFVRYTGKDCGNKLIETITQRNPIYGSDFSKFTGEKYRYAKVYVDGSRYALQMANLNDGKGLDWIILHSVPMLTYYRNFYISFIVMSCCTFVLLIVGVIASIVTARIVMNPLYQIMQQAEYIKTLQLEKVEKSLSGNLSFFTEIRSLQTSFKSMTGRIKQFRSFIPDHILSVIEAEVNQGAESQEFQKNQKGTEEGSVDTGSESRGTSITEGYFHGKGLVSNALKTSLTSSNITVMVVMFSDLNEILETHSASDIADATRELLVTLKKAISNTNGQFVFVTAKQAMIAWNTLMSQTDHVIRACKTARACTDQVRALQKQWAQRDLPQLGVTIGLATGVAYFGNVGNERNKFFTVIGKPVATSEHLCALNSNWGTEIICSEEISELMKHEYHFRTLENTQNGHCIELGGPKDDEAWVREMQTKGNWSMFNEAYSFYEKELYDEASTLFSNYLEKNPEDIPAQKLLQNCSHHLLTL